MPFLLSDDAFYALAIERKNSPVVEWSKKQSASTIFGSVLSIGRIYDDIQHSHLTANQKEIARTETARLARKFERVGLLQGLDIDICRQWSDLIGMDLKEPDGTAVPQDLRMTFATAIAKGLIWVGQFEASSMTPLIALGLHGYDPEINISWP